MNPRLPIKITEIVPDNLEFQNYQPPQYQPPVGSEPELIPAVDPVGFQVPIENSIAPQFNPLQPQIIEPTTPELTPERLELLEKLTVYRYSRFYKRIIDQFPEIFDNLREIPTEEIEERITAIEDLRKNQTASRQTQLLFRNFIQMAEKGLTTIGWEVDGVGSLILEDEDILDDVEDVRIKYGTKFTIAPEYRLGFNVLSIFAECNNINSQKKRNAALSNISEVKQTLESHFNGESKDLQNKFSEI